MRRHRHAIGRDRQPPCSVAPETAVTAPGRSALRKCDGGFARPHGDVDGVRAVVRRPAVVRATVSTTDGTARPIPAAPSRKPASRSVADTPQPAPPTQPDQRGRPTRPRDERSGAPAPATARPTPSDRSGTARSPTARHRPRSKPHAADIRPIAVAIRRPVGRDRASDTRRARIPASTATCRTASRSA